MIKMIKTGDWAKALEILETGDRLRRAIDWAVEREAQDARRSMIKGITNQAPGGKGFEPLKAITLILRKAKGFRGTKALIVTAFLRNSIVVKKAGVGVYFVGVLRSTARPNGVSNYNVARVQELGAVITIRVTTRMHNWLMMTLRKAGYAGFGRDKRVKFDRDKIFGYKRKTSGAVMRTIVVRIPPRPFVQPTIEEIASSPDAVRRRLTMRIATRMKLTLGS